MTSDEILTVVNVIVTFASCIGAYKSLKYFRKSQYLIVYARTNSVLVEVSKMINKLLEALAKASPYSHKIRGTNAKRSVAEAVSNIGQELMASLNVIRKDIPQEYAENLKLLENDGEFQLQQYINSLIYGDAISDDGLDRMKFNCCQTRLNEIQIFLKQKLTETECKLK